MSDLKHYGMPFRSGRYPWGTSGWGSGSTAEDFQNEVRDLRRKGYSYVEIAKKFNIKTGPLRARISIANNESRNNNTARAVKLKDKGYSNTEIGRLMGKNESSIRALLDPVLQERARLADITADIIAESVHKDKYIDIGLGVENHLGIRRDKLKVSLEMLKADGYKIHYLDQKQMGTGKMTSLMVITKEDVPWLEVHENREKIKMPLEWHSDDKGYTYTPTPFKHVKDSRVQIRYAEEGGSDKDGVIELRRNVDDISLGGARYAQVRIGMDNGSYLKGMAVYADDLPKGVDIIFNTNKKIGTPKEDVYKPMSDDPDNPFGASIKVDGRKGALNIVNEEGDWEKWSKNLSSQMLSKQTPKLIKQQLALSLAVKEEELEELNALTNPTVKKHLLLAYADELDSSSMHLKAAALPRQATQVLLPFPKMKEDQIYAPNFKDGELVALVRHPHGGTFEIPVLKVNNRQKDIVNIIGRPKDAVGIHPKVAERLSGADFDGDTVIVIPTDGKNIKTSSPLKGLQNFNPREIYKYYEGMSILKEKAVPKVMGDISNLITDMTIKGANEYEIARAVRHSMVVIDARKHKLDYRESARVEGIASLKEKYQGDKRAGASTLISKSKARVYVDERRQGYKIDPATGKKVYSYTGDSYVNDKGATVYKKTKSKLMLETDDAHTISSGTTVENIYADYANKLKTLANETRKVYADTKDMEYSPSANKAYKPQVSSLVAQYNIALKNAPLERKAQVLAGVRVKEKTASHPELDYGDKQKLQGQEIMKARLEVGAKKTRIDIKPKEWEAIQSGAITPNVLKNILKNADLDKVKELATPRATTTVSPAKIAKAKAMKASGHTAAEIAEAIGSSVTTVKKITE